MLQPLKNASEEINPVLYNFKVILYFAVHTEYKFFQRVAFHLGLPIFRILWLSQNH